MPTLNPKLSARLATQSRREFIHTTSRLSLGAGLLGLGTLACERPGPEKSQSEVDAPTPVVATPAAEATPPPSIVGMYAPRLDRIHSAGIYQTMATRAAAVDLVNRETQRATVDARQSIVELDVFFDDHISRSEKVVLLGQHAGGLVGFCYRFLVDMKYPSPHAEGDGWGAPEFRNPRLTVLGSTYDLERLQDDKPPVSLDGTTAHYRVFGDHDAALVYFPRPAQLDSSIDLGIEDPVEAVQNSLAHCSSMFGLDFVLMSPASFEKMRSALARHKSRLDIATFAAGMAITALALWPLLGPAVAGVISIESLGGAGRKIVAKALPVAFELGRDLILREDGFVARHFGEDARFSLLGVDFPRGDTDGIELIGKFLAAVAVQRDDSAQFVEFEGKGDRRLAQVFVPDSQMCLSAELLSRGLVRLDMQDRHTLLEFPELVTSALAAVETGQNLAAAWAKDDAEYVTQLAALNRVVAG